MELKKRYILYTLCILIVALSAYAVTQKVFVDTNYNLHNLLNISNISMSGNFTDGTLTIQSGVITGATISGYYNQTVIAGMDLYNGTEVNDSIVNHVNTTAKNWSLLTGYPAACPANTYITQLDDSTTCTGISDIYVLTAGDTMTGNLIGTGLNMSYGNFSNNVIVLGDVGIGTTVPTAILDVYHVNAAQTLYHSDTTGTSATDGFKVGLDSNDNGFIWNYEAHSLYFGTNAITRTLIDSSGNVDVNSGQLYVQQSSGNVGIGTSAPNYLLDVNGTINASDIYASNRIGIGTSSPGDTLHLKYPLSHGIRIETAAAYATSVEFTDGIDNFSVGLRSSTDNFVISEARGVTSDERLVIAKTSGNVGIGTTAPAHKLEVSGSMNISGGLNVSGDFNLNDKFNITASNGNTAFGGNASWGDGKIYWNGSALVIKVT